MKLSHGVLKADVKRCTREVSMALHFKAYSSAMAHVNVCARKIIECGDPDRDAELLKFVNSMGNSILNMSRSDCDH